MQIVKYHNQLNRVPLKAFTEVEHNFFVTLLYKFKNQGVKELCIPKSELIELTNFRQGSKSNFDSSVMRFVQKLLDFKISFSPDSVLIESFVPFPNAVYHTVDKVLKISIHKSFENYINLLETSFTQFELSEFVEISGKYSKILYRLLKQYKDTGFLVCPWNEFLDIMDIPSSYKTSDIERQILKPAILELSVGKHLFKQNTPTFENLSYTKIRGKTRGRGIERIEFSWKIPKVKEEEINIFSSIDELRSWLFCNVDSGNFSTNIVKIGDDIVSIARFARKSGSKYKGTKILVGGDDYTSKEKADWALSVIYEAIKKDQLDQYIINDDDFSDSAILYSRLKMKITDKENLKRCSDEVREIFPKMKKFIEKYLFFPKDRFEKIYPDVMLDVVLRIDEVFISYEHRSVSMIASYIKDNERRRLSINDIQSHQQYETLKSVIFKPTEKQEEGFTKAILNND